MVDWDFLLGVQGKRLVRVLQYLQGTVRSPVGFRPSYVLGRCPPIRSSTVPCPSSGVGVDPLTCGTSRRWDRVSLPGWTIYVPLSPRLEGGGLHETDEGLLQLYNSINLLNIFISRFPFFDSQCLLGPTCQRQRPCLQPHRGGSCDIVACPSPSLTVPSRDSKDPLQGSVRTGRGVGVGVSTGRHSLYEVRCGLTRFGFMFPL